MRRIIISVALVLALAGATNPARAATTDTITVTVSLTEAISVSLDNNVWNIGSIGLSQSTSLATVTATNNGNVTVDLDIKGSNGAGGWSIGPQSADTFQVSVTSPALVLTTTDQALASALVVSGTKTINLNYQSPTSDSFGGGVDQGFSVTVTASKTP